MADSVALALVASFAWKTTAQALVRPSWNDEDYTVWFAGATWRIFGIGLRRVDAVMAPYYLVMRALPDDLIWYRLVSVVAMTGAVTLAALLAKRINRSAWGGTLAALVCTSSPGLSRIGNEARGFALATLFVTALAYLTVTKRRGVAVVAVAAVLSHLFAVFPVVALLAVGRSRWPAWASVFAVFTPLAYVGYLQREQVAWIAEKPAGQWRVGLQFIGVSPIPLTMMLATIAVAAVMRRRLVVAMAAWWLGPLVALTVLSMVHPLLAPRYVVESAPGGAVLFAWLAVEAARQLRRHAEAHELPGRLGTVRRAGRVQVDVSGAAYAGVAEACSDRAPGPTCNCLPVARPSHRRHGRSVYGRPPPPPPPEPKTQSVGEFTSQTVPPMARQVPRSASRPTASAGPMLAAARGS